MDTAHPARRCYLYAIVRSGHIPAPAMAGLDGEAVFAIGGGAANAVAVVSAIDRSCVRPERAHLKAHNDVISALMREQTVLPVAFGTIADHADAVRQFIAGRASQISDQLQRLDGSVEMGLRARLDVPDIYRHLVDHDAELREARDAVFGRGSEPGRDVRIALGMKVEQALDATRRRHREHLQPLLAKWCIDVRSRAPRDGADIMNLSCLVRREQLPAFEAELTAAVALMDDSVSFDLSGPWAPHHFCSIEFGFGADGDDDD